jgi:hypothetical protein
MDTLISVAQISLAAAQFSVAAALVGAASLGAWRDKHRGHH